MFKKPELLCPAGDLERLQFAVMYGADAVYVGGESYGMRSSPKNFSIEQLFAGVSYAHKFNKKVYLTLNTIPTNEEILGLPNYIKRVSQTGIDAFIVADLGVLSIVKKYAPQIEVHMSTQVGIANYAAASAAYEMGAKRVVLARELSLEDIAFIRQNTPKELELEAFVHGAMCMSFSGRCLISHYLTQRDANKGECSQPCRWKWNLTSEHLENHQYEIAEDYGGSYILNANDLCTAPFIDLICKAGIDSLKIEGRAKTFYYVASTASAYRKAVDEYTNNPNKVFVCPPFTLEELTKTSHRNYSTGFYFGAKGAMQETKQGKYIKNWELIGIVENYANGLLNCSQRGKFNLGDELEILTPSGDVYQILPEFILDKDKNQINSTPHPKMNFSIPCNKSLPQYSIIRKKIDL